MFDYYKLSIVGFGSPADFDIKDVEALCNWIERIGYFLGSIQHSNINLKYFLLCPTDLAGPDVKLTCTKMTKKDLKGKVEVDSRLYEYL